MKASTAQLAVTASAVDPINGDVAEVVGNQVFLLVNGTGQPATDFGIGTSGTLTKGDVYLLAGQGAPGWTPATSNGCKATGTNKVKATATIIGKPQQATFDSSGNLLIASNVTGEMNVIAVPVTTGNYYGFTGMPAGYTCFIAGFTPATANLPAAPAINVHSASTVLSLGASGGLLKGGTQNVALTTAAGAFVLNFASSTQSLYGQTLAAGSFTQVGGGGTATAVAGAQTLNALGSGTTAFAVQAPRLDADASGNLWIGNDGQTQGSWVLPAATGTVTIDGTATPVTVGKAYKFAGNGTSAKTTPPTNGAKAVTTSISTIVGVTGGSRREYRLLMGGSVATVTKINGAYVIANSSGTYYTQAMTAGDFYTIAGSAAHTLGKFRSPASISSDSNGNLWIADSNSHVLYELTGGPTGPALPSTTTAVVSSTSGTSVFGQSVTFTATVQRQRAGQRHADRHGDLRGRLAPCWAPARSHAERRRPPTPPLTLAVGATPSPPSTAGTATTAPAPAARLPRRSARRPPAPALTSSANPANLRPGGDLHRHRQRQRPGAAARRRAR